MSDVPPQAAPERLTPLLRAAGVLPRGEVTDVAIESSRDTLISHVTRLRLTYGDGAAGPSHVFVKSAHAGGDPRWAEFGRREVDFYRDVAAATPAGLLPHCYEASAPPGAPWYLMIEDLTATHEVLGDWPLPPPLERWHAIVATHARFHAAWWDREGLGVAEFEGYIARMPADLAAFADRLGERLSAERRRIYERLIDAAPRMLDRYRSHRNLTIVHGDSHVWNALLPRRPEHDTVRLIDWDSWRVDTATDDLAYMLALHFFPDWRHRYERESLQRYHDTLVAHGVRGYAFDALWEDYRHSVLWQITTPMAQARLGIPSAVWWSHLDRIMQAVHDLDCLDLL